MSRHIVLNNLKAKTYFLYKLYQSHRAEASRDLFTSLLNTEGF